MDRLEVFALAGRDVRSVGLVQDAWLSGGHTVIPDGRGHVLLSCTGSDSVIAVGEVSLQVTWAWRVPESLYGSNFRLRRGDSLLDHYIHNNLQLTHLNCASPWRGGVVVSTLIQGAIGWFSPAGEYRELVRGFVGCHGVRASHPSQTLYFSDSCLGALVFLDKDLRIAGRVGTGSAWLHDSVQLKGDFFATAITDRNHVEIIDVHSRTVLEVISGSQFGLGSQFVHFGA